MAETTEQYRARMNQLKTNIENEPYMKNMRPDIAEAISKTGNRQADIEVRQENLESDFAAVQQDARSNTPSGAELAVAAGPYNTLGERLDAEQNEVNAQLVQTSTKINQNSNEITILDNKVSGLGTNVIFKGEDTRVNIISKTGAENGDEWYDTTNKTVLRYNGQTWIDVGNINIGERSIAPINTTFIDRFTNNKIDQSDFVAGYVDAQGNVVPGGVSTTNLTLIPLNPNSNYMIESDIDIPSMTLYTATYNAEGVFVIRLLPVTSISPNNPISFPTGPNNRNLRLSVNAQYLKHLFLHEGSQSVPLVDKFKIDNDLIDFPDSTEGQVDLVDKLAIHNGSNLPLKAEVQSQGNFNVYQPIADGKYVKHIFTKDALDDFTLYASSVFGHFDGSVWVDEQYIMAGSNKELALLGKPSGSSQAAQWFPEHNNIGTAFSNSKKILFDGVDVASLSTRSIQDVSVVKLVQDMNYLYPDDADPLANLYMITTINNRGVSYDGNITFLRNTFVDRMYVAMLPTIIPPVDTLRTSMLKDYDATKVSGLTNIDEGDKLISVAFLNKNGSEPNKNYVLAQSIHTPERTFRKGTNNRRDPVVFLEHRNNGSVQKVYPQIYNLAEVVTGESVNFGATIFTGILDNASKLLF